MFAKLEAHLARLAGSHSGVERTLFDDLGADAATHMHESIHDRIFYETADGLLHLFAQRLESDAEDPSARGAAKRLSRRLFEETRQAHEAAATYIGIEYLRVDIFHARGAQSDDAPAARAIASLPPEYVTYRELFRRLLDRRLATPWLRLGFAWAITHWAFSSARLGHALRWFGEGLAELDEIPGPGARLAAARAAIENFGADAWFETLMREIAARAAADGATWKDLDDPTEWPTVSGARKAEIALSALFDATRGWLDQRVARSYWPRDIGDDVRALMERFDFEFRDPTKPLVATVEELSVDARALARVAERARVRRAFSAPLQRFDMGAIRACAAEERGAPLSVTLMASLRWGRRRFRCAIRRGAGAALPGMSLNAREAETLLRWVRHAEQEGVVLLPLFVVCDLSLQSEDALARVIPLVERAGLAARKSAPPFEMRPTTGVVYIVNYVEHGIMGILEHVPGAVTNLDVQVDDAGARVGVMHFVPAAGDVHACLKIVPRYDLGGFIVFQRAVRERGDLKLDMHASDAFEDGYGLMLRALLDYWDPL